MIGSIALEVKTWEATLVQTGVHSLKLQTLAKAVKIDSAWGNHND